MPTNGCVVGWISGFWPSFWVWALGRVWWVMVGDGG